jgi:replication factor A1
MPNNRWRASLSPQKFAVHSIFAGNFLHPMTLALLSDGILHNIVVENRRSDGPVLQIVQIKEVAPKPNTPRRYRVALSDGRHHASAMCSQAMNTEITNDRVNVYNIIRLTRYTVNETTGKKVIVIIDFELVSAVPTDILGSPSPLREDERAAPPAAPPCPAPRGELRPRPPTSAQFMSISALTSYLTTAWTIQAKIVQKTQLSHWSKPQSEGALFSVTLKDKGGNEIRGTFFKAEADKFYPILELNKVYTITGGRIRQANKRFSSVANDYEITFDSNTRFDEVADDGLIGGRVYNFAGSLREIQSMKEGTMVDVVAVIKEVEEPAGVSTKKGDSHRRRVFLCDSSRIQMELTLWGKEALDFPSDAAGRVVQIKDARVRDFRGKQLVTTNGTMIEIRATEPRARELEQWWASGGNQELFESASTGGADGGNTFGYLAVINERKLGTSKDLADYLTFYGQVNEIVIPSGRLLYYNSCPLPTCKNRKLGGSLVNGGSLVCKTCGAQVTNPRERFAFQFKAADFSGSGFISALGDDTIGQPILGWGAHDWAELTKNEDVEGCKNRVRERWFSDFRIKVRIRADDYGDDLRPKMMAVAVARTNYAEAAKFFAAEIQKY